MMLENTNYFSDVLMALMAVRQGISGELIRCEPGCQHYCRRLLFEPDGSLRRSTVCNVTPNGDFYPYQPSKP